MGVGLGLGTFLIARRTADAADEVTFWYATNPSETDDAKAVDAAWNKSHKPQVKAQPVPAGNSTEEVVPAAIAAVVIFIVFRRYFVQGIATTGLNE